MGESRGERRDEPCALDGGEYARVGQGSIRKIIFQPGQFVCASETERGATTREHLQHAPDRIHYEIADWASAGTD